MYTIKDQLQKELKEIKEAGLFKEERIIVSDQKADIEVKAGGEVINFCANNYLGLANNKELAEAACDVMKNRGFGLSSVRFICGTQDIHKELEEKLARFFR